MAIGIGTLVALTFGLGITAFLGLSSVGGRVRGIVGVTVKEQTLAHSMDSNGSFIMGATKGILMRGLQGDRAGIERNIQDFNVYADRFQGDINQMQSLGSSPESAIALSDMQATLSAGRLSNKSLYQAAEAPDMVSAFALYDKEIKPLETRQKQDTIRLLEIQDSNLRSEEQSAETYVGNVRWIIAMLLVLSSLSGIGMMYGIHRINVTLRNAVAELAEASVQIASAAGQVAASSQSVAQGASEQSATIEETSSASAEINLDGPPSYGELTYVCADGDSRSRRLREGQSVTC